jgi:hypothetical protein
LTADETERFRRMCYDDPLLYHNLGEHVFEKIRGQGGTSPITPSTSAQLAPGGVPLPPSYQVSTGGVPFAQLSESNPVTPDLPLLPSVGQYATSPLPPLQLTQVSQAGAQLPAPEHFAAQIRTLFALRNYQVTTANSDTVDTLILTKAGKRAIAHYLWQDGMISDEPVRQLLSLLTGWEADHGYVVTNGHFTLQAQDLAANQPIQLIDGPELSSLINGMRTAPAVKSWEPSAGQEHDDATTLLSGATRSLHDKTAHLDLEPVGTANGQEPAQRTPLEGKEETLPAVPPPAD